MDKLVILCLIISINCVFAMIICFISYLDKSLTQESTKIEDITMTIVIVLGFLSLSYLIYYSIKHPQPTFRQVCEANGGIYIDNNGRAGDSCVYNGGNPI